MNLSGDRYPPQAPARYRGWATALLAIVVSIIGTALGVLGVGLINLAGYFFRDGKFVFMGSQADDESGIALAAGCIAIAVWVLSLLLCSQLSRLRRSRPAGLALSLVLNVASVSAVVAFAIYAFALWQA